MPIESGDKLSDLNPLWPLTGDPAGEGDNHTRLIKSIVQLDAWSRDADDLKTLTELNALYLSLAGGTLTGPLVLAGDASANLEAVPQQQLITSLAGYLALTGGTLTGPLTMDADPAAPLETATKQYVDGAIAGLAISQRFQVSESYVAGTDGPATAGSTWQRRELNTVNVNDIPGASFDAGNFELTVPPGVYEIYSAAVGYECGSIKSRVQNLGATLDSGLSAYSRNGTAPSGGTAISSGKFTFGSDAVLTLDMWGSVANSNGMGRGILSAGEVEKYSLLDIRKVG